MITRLPVVDDVGDKVSGTAITAAWWTQVEDMIDARWSQVVISVTGLERRLDIGEADFVLISNQAQLDITGIAPPANPAKIGKRIHVLRTGGGVLNFHHEDAATAEDGRLQMFRTPISVAPLGALTFAYGGLPGSQRWWLVGTSNILP